AADSPYIDCDEGINVRFIRRQDRFRMVRRGGYKAVYDTQLNTVARGFLPLNNHPFAGVGGRFLEFILLIGFFVQQSTWGPMSNDSLPVSMAASFSQVGIVSNKTAYYFNGVLFAAVPWLSTIPVLDVGYINHKFVFLAESGFEPGQTQQN